MYWDLNIKFFKAKIIDGSFRPDGSLSVNPNDILY